MSCSHGNWPPCDQCDELDAAYNRGYAEGGKISIDLTMKHLRHAESAESRLAEVERDAARYRYLADETMTNRETTVAMWEASTKEMLDITIDSAIRHLKEKS